MSYEDNPAGTRKEIKRIKTYLNKKGLKEVTPGMIVDAALATTKRLGAGDFTFYVELK
ncbi:MAG: hypothetical protein ACNYVW_09475 [Methanosarcinales archaeon]